MELPNYRMPSAKSVGMLLWDKSRDFIQRAFTVIFVATLVIWFLNQFTLTLNVATDPADSMLAAVAGVIAPVFGPMGFGDWRITAALISGFMAKESVVATIARALRQRSRRAGRAHTADRSRAARVLPALHPMRRRRQRRAPRARHKMDVLRHRLPVRHRLDLRLHRLPRPQRFSRLITHIQRDRSIFRSLFLFYEKILQKIRDWMTTSAGSYAIIKTRS